MVVEVCNARNLMPKDGQGTACAYAVVDFDGQRRRTATRPRDLNPHWGERLEFLVHHPDAMADTLELNVYNDKKAVAGAGSGRRGGTFLGKVKVAAASFARAGDEALVYYPLEKRSVFSQIKGEIGLKIWFVDDPPPAPAAPAAAPEGEKKADDATPADKKEPAEAAAAPAAAEEKKPEAAAPAEEKKAEDAKPEEKKAEDAGKKKSPEKGKKKDGEKPKEEGKAKEDMKEVAVPPSPSKAPPPSPSKMQLATAGVAGDLEGTEREKPRRESARRPAAMGEEWRAVARRVPAFFQPVHVVDEHSVDARLPRLICGASDALHLRYGDLAHYRHGVDHIVDPLHQPVLPSTPLGEAISMLREHHDLHTAGARFLALYGERLGFLQPATACQRDLVLLPGPDPAANGCWEQWLANRAEALDRKREVSRKLRLALAYDVACFDAVNVARLLPARSPNWHAWIQAAELLAVDAYHQASAAADDARQMRGAVWMESWNATTVLGRT